MTDTPPLDPIIVSDLRAELAKAHEETAVLRAENRLFREATVEVIEVPASVTTINTEYEVLSAEVRKGLADGVKVGGAVLVVLGAASAILPEMHLPAADLTVLTAISAAVTAFLSWAARNGIK